MKLKALVAATLSVMLAIAQVGSVQIGVGLSGGGGSGGSVSDVLGGTGISVATNGNEKTVSINTAVTMSREHAQSFADHYIETTTGTSTAYVGCPSDNTAPGRAYTVLTEGMVLFWTPHTNGAGGATTINPCTLGATAIKQSDGATNPTSTQIVSGTQIQMWYDGTNFRLPAASSVASGSYITSVSIASAASNSTCGSANCIKLHKVYNPYPVSINRLWFKVTTASAGQTAAVGVYNSTCTSLLATTGAQSTTNANTEFEITFAAVTLPQGDLYWAHTISDTTAAVASTNYSSSAILNLLHAGSQIMLSADGTVTAGALPSSCGNLTSLGSGAGSAAALIGGWTE